MQQFVFAAQHYSPFVKNYVFRYTNFQSVPTDFVLLDTPKGDEVQPSARNELPITKHFITTSHALQVF